MKIETGRTERCWLVTVGPEDAIQASDRVRAAARAFGVRKLSRAVGVSHTLVAKWVLGERPLCGEHWTRAMETLGLTAATGRDPESGASNVDTGSD